MTKEELQKTIDDSELFTFKDIMNVNHKPHPYVIGPKHISYASDHFNGMLSESTCEMVPCAHPGCTYSYKEHTSDKVLFLQLKRHMSANEANSFFVPLKETLIEQKIDGVTFVETPEKFRIK